MDDRTQPTFASDSHHASNSDVSESKRQNDTELLDAYSRAVTTVVSETIPSVISVTGTERRGSGSGILLTADGYAVTNSHVAAGQLKLITKTSDGDRIEAKLVGDDPANDLSLIKLQAKELPFVKLGDSEGLQAGQLVVAMGSPIGLHSTVSTGVVSALGRGMRAESGHLIENVIQHSAPINPGNSGGPLVDTRCQIIGINTAIIAYTQGIGFAVPSGTVDWFFSQILNHGKIKRHLLGISAATVKLSRSFIIDFDLLTESAVEVMEIEKGGVADNCGVRVGDILVAINDRIIETVDDIHRLLNKLPVSREIELSVIRNGKKVHLTLSFGDA